ncbi:hypothetical protein FHETE_1119 [Fusarium heterosporum]|uniref:Uncharacterized protein n=1 Tax=Fusarium heterosporum TaxID=42747 RepID=A0A8H5X236_FUSHE|nr:hypothetical protein FHETE_1119 [Fusarium heterosporum]
METYLHVFFRQTDPKYYRQNLKHFSNSLGSVYAVQLHRNDAILQLTVHCDPEDPNRDPEDVDWILHRMWQATDICSLTQNWKQYGYVLNAHPTQVAKRILDKVAPEPVEPLPKRGMIQEAVLEKILSKMSNKGEILVFSRKANTPGNERKLQKLISDYNNKGITIQVSDMEFKITFPAGSQAKKAATYTAKSLRARMEEEGLMSDWSLKTK